MWFQALVTGISHQWHRLFRPSTAIALDMRKCNHYQPYPLVPGWKYHYNQLMQLTLHIQR